MSERPRRPLPPVSILMPACTEEAGIVFTVESTVPVPDRPRLAPARA